MKPFLSCLLLLLLQPGPSSLVEGLALFDDTRHCISSTNAPSSMDMLFLEGEETCNSQLTYYYIPEWMDDTNNGYRWMHESFQVRNTSTTTEEDWVDVVGARVMVYLSLDQTKCDIGLGGSYPGDPLQTSCRSCSFCGFAGFYMEARTATFTADCTNLPGGRKITTCESTFPFFYPVDWYDPAFGLFEEDGDSIPTDLPDTMEPTSTGTDDEDFNAVTAVPSITQAPTVAPSSGICKGDMIFTDCGNSCAATCDNAIPLESEGGGCPDFCVPGCFCPPEKPIAVDHSGTCVESRDLCPSSAPIEPGSPTTSPTSVVTYAPTYCGGDMVFIVCGGSCPSPTCQSRLAEGTPPPCEDECISGCYCPEGGILVDGTGTCVDDYSQCPEGGTGETDPDVVDTTGPSMMAPTMSPSSSGTVEGTAVSTNNDGGICKGDLIYKECGNTCPPTCDNAFPLESEGGGCIYPNACTPGCYCPPEKPIAVDKSGRCVESRDLCPSSPPVEAGSPTTSPTSVVTFSGTYCSGDMEFITCGGSCPRPTCNNPAAEGPCRNECISSCYCPDGTIHADGTDMCVSDYSKCPEGGYGTVQRAKDTNSVAGTTATYDWKSELTITLPYQAIITTLEVDVVLKKLEDFLTQTLLESNINNTPLFSAATVDIVLQSYEHNSVAASGDEDEHDVVDVEFTLHVTATTAIETTQCPSPTENKCVNDNNYAECVALLVQGCLEVLALESCPLKFRCGTWGDDESATTAAIPSERQVATLLTETNFYGFYSEYLHKDDGTVSSISGGADVFEKTKEVVFQVTGSGH